MAEVIWAPAARASLKNTHKITGNGMALEMHHIYPIGDKMKMCSSTMNALPLVVTLNAMCSVIFMAAILN